MINDLAKASEMLQKFKGESLSNSVTQLERSFIGANKLTSVSHLAEVSISNDLLTAALLIKRNASQIDEVVHTLGILLALPNILDQDEQVESLSLAAGNTGKRFDLETNKRIAEFTFIQWQGGPEVIRQNKVFKDFYFLAEEETPKLRQLYVIGTEHVMRFFNSQRELPQILAGNAKLGNNFHQRYGNQFHFVSEYYRIKRDVVKIEDVRQNLSMIELN